MSHQTGIHPNDELREFISKCKHSGSVRVLKVGIKDEQLTLEEYKEPSGDWGDDYQRYVKRLILIQQPTYLLFRLDSVDTAGTYQWLFISWSPEEAKVRDKMLYASTKATLKMEFGGGSIIYDYFASTFDEICYNSFINWVKRKKNDAEGGDGAPLTRQEQELKSVKRDEAILSSVSRATRTAPGLEFPIDDDAISALFDLKNQVLGYVQLSIDIDKEQIKLDIKLSNDEFDVKMLRSLIPDNAARYHVFVFPHTHDGEMIKSYIFVYSIPGHSCSVKQRMLYSSCKSALLNAITDINKIGINLDRKLETDNHRELTRDFLTQELHPKEDIAKAKFEKPKGPMGKRGAKRIIRNNDED